MSDPIRPPHLRQAIKDSKSCYTCKMFWKNKNGTGSCWGYGNWKVRVDQVCDSWASQKASGTWKHLS